MAKVAVVFHSGYGHTLRMAQSVAEGADAELVTIDVDGNVSDEGWDSEMQSYPHVFELDGRIYMAYLGNQVGRGGFGLAVLDGELR